MRTSSTPLLLAGALSVVGGLATAQDYQARMGEPLRGLTASELTLFQNGRTAFNTVLTEAQGLGPIFNDSSCGQCHSEPDIGGFSTETVTRFGDNSSGVFDPLDGTGPSGLDKGGSLQQVQVLASHPEAQEVVPPEANHTHKRATGHAFGAGLVQRIDDAQIFALETTPPSGSVSGLSRVVTPSEGGPDRVGKFGWKGHTPTMLSFSGGAGKNEVGLTNRFETTENAPNGDAVLLAGADSVADPEDSAALANSILGTSDTLEMIDYWDAFQQLLAPPPQTPKTGMTGEAIFMSIGCGDCHVPEMNTAADANPVFSSQPVRSYSDYLLHDMGPALADGIHEGGIADEFTYRSTPLWGISQKTGLLHDASATGGTFGDNVTTAITLHGGEGTDAKNAFVALSSTGKDHVIAFLSSLGRCEFDVDGANNNQNNRVDAFDYFFMRNHATGDLFTGEAPGSFTPDDPGAICDIDADGDFDMRDFGVMMEAWTD